MSLSVLFIYLYSLFSCFFFFNWFLIFVCFYTCHVSPVMSKYYINFKSHRHINLYLTLLVKKKFYSWFFFFFNIDLLKTEPCHKPRWTPVSRGCISWWTMHMHFVLAAALIILLFIRQGGRRGVWLLCVSILMPSSSDFSNPKNTSFGHSNSSPTYHHLK